MDKEDNFELDNNRNDTKFTMCHPDGTPCNKEEIKQWREEDIEIQKEWEIFRALNSKIGYYSVSLKIMSQSDDVNKKVGELLHKCIIDFLEAKKHLEEGVGHISLAYNFERSKDEKFNELIDRWS